MKKCSVCRAKDERIYVKMTKTTILCEGCLQICNEILKEEEIKYEDAYTKPIEKRSKVYATCFICNKTNLEQARLICFGNVEGVIRQDRSFICNQCVGKLTKIHNQAVQGLSLKK